MSDKIDKENSIDKQKYEIILKVLKSINESSYSFEQLFKSIAFILNEIFINASNYISLVKEEVDDKIVFLFPVTFDKTGNFTEFTVEKNNPDDTFINQTLNSKDIIFLQEDDVVKIGIPLIASSLENKVIGVIIVNTSIKNNFFNEPFNTNNLEILKIIFIEISNAIVNTKNLKDKLDYYKQLEIEISERKKMEAKLLKSEQKYREMIEKMSDGYFEVDLTGKVIYVNSSMERIFGLSKEKIIGLKNLDFMNKDEAKKVLKAFYEVFNSGNSIDNLEWTFKYLCIEKDIEISVSLKYDFEGKKEGFRGTCRDISERKKLEKMERDRMNYFYTMLEVLPNPIFFIDIDLKIIHVNKTFESLFNINRNDIIGKSIKKSQILKGNICSKIEFMSNYLMNNQFTDAIMADIQWENKAGVCFDLLINGYFYINTSSKLIGLLFVISDITTQKKAERKLQESEIRYRSLFNIAPVIIYSIDTHGIIRDISASIEHLGYEKTQLIGQHFRRFVYEKDADDHTRNKVLPKYLGQKTGYLLAPKLIDERRSDKLKKKGDVVEYDDDEINNIINSSLIANKDPLKFVDERRNDISDQKGMILVKRATRNLLIRLKPEGWVENELDALSKLVYVNCSAAGFKENGKFAGTVGVMLDYSKQKQLEEELKEVANTDSLTGLPTRRLLADIYTQIVQKNRYSTYEIALLEIDLDRFKEVNDTFGHDAGDFLLKEVAKRMKKVFRVVDTVSRVGGDEFVVVLCLEKYEYQFVVNVCSRLIETIVEPYYYSEKDSTFEIHIGLSIGVSIFPHHATEFEDLLKISDKMMYLIKNQEGKNGFTIFQDPYIYLLRRNGLSKKKNEIIKISK